jgi:hypothetical protein
LHGTWKKLTFVSSIVDRKGMYFLIGLFTGTLSEGRKEVTLEIYAK